MAAYATVSSYDGGQIHLVPVANIVAPVVQGGPAVCGEAAPIWQPQFAQATCPACWTAIHSGPALDRATVGQIAQEPRP